MNIGYTDEKQTQIVIALLKQHGIKKIIASPGTTNMTLVLSMQHDSHFEIYSSVDERSAAYMACGLAAESGEPVVISCTGATASRNYMPGLTEAYYRKLPVLAVTATKTLPHVGHHIAQVIDRSVMPVDTVVHSVTLPLVKDDEDFKDCEIKVNQAVLELCRRGGGPVHINLPTVYSQNYEVQELPDVRVIKRFVSGAKLPPLPTGKIGVFIGAHAIMSDVETATLDAFCAANNAVVFCDHTSGYKGKYRVQYSIVGCQSHLDHSSYLPDLLIHIGEVTGDYYNTSGRHVWRVSMDGELRDTFGRLQYVFEMSERQFFENYTETPSHVEDGYLRECLSRVEAVRNELPELPFSNIWIASMMASNVPEGATVHFGILNSLRAWNFFETPVSVTAMCNVGGFGIDGGVSSLIGASLANPQKLYFGVIGDLAFFYDMNVMGNRHVGNNVRILLVNNGKGTEFRLSHHPAAVFGDEADVFVSAGGHFGNKSPELVKHYAEDLGYDYVTAASKEEFLAVYEDFVCPELTQKPMLFEVFTDSKEEAAALELVRSIKKDLKGSMRDVAKRALGAKHYGALKKVLKN
ncbi:2-succinyl-5-enolpyruvyl-6-hydroxy-3-cyclohexene-1-carboxylate synthase [Alkalispirochaeta americana]|uniref:2-succinyl-5-enolpyruvyl-6-hydroxy-3-cyclohexene-1-carboxylate synthase n=1 Tax=Alkalispirochaeta americana TaxID=159291 RepID=A0A1N6XKD6_9SPIO|nr:thiamine pyrophosphate-binding protein [Alkalispirochaeta americana]SIR02727.1 2-succinyl-5-enolpyruvyl-6-hydroxy-3-cyclohexene-1-carboxylate synthase [Alkalispirochaeta americana]